MPKPRQRMQPRRPNKRRPYDHMRAMSNLPVVPICRRYFRLRRRANHNDLLAHPAPMKRDVSADRHEPWGGDAMDADAARDERGGRGRRNRAVLISRRWDQASGLAMSA